MLYQIYKGVNGIFSPSHDIPLGGKPVLICGDLYQLSPVQAKPIFVFNETATCESYITICVIDLNLRNWMKSIAKKMTKNWSIALEIA